MRNFQFVVVILSLTLFGAACSKKKDDAPKAANNAMAPEMKADDAMTPPPADMPADMPATTDATPVADAAPAADAPAADAPAADAPSAEPKLVCTKLITEEMIKTHGITDVKDAGPGAPARTMNCPFKKENESYSIGLVCPTWNESTFKITMENGKKSKHLKDAKDVEGLGRMAYVGKIHGIVMLQFWDDDTMCYATMPGKDEAFMIAIAKDFVANLKPATIQ